LISDLLLPFRFSPSDLSIIGLLSIRRPWRPQGLVSHWRAQGSIPHDGQPVLQVSVGSSPSVGAALLFTVVDLRRGSASKHDRFPMRTSVFGYMVF
jgi:hypothetical protein